MVTIIKYKKSTIDHAIYTKLFSYGTVSYLTVSAYDVINTTNDDIAFTELRRFFEEYFYIKFQEESILGYLNIWIFKSPLGFSIYHNDHITELVNKCPPTGKFRKVDTPFRTDSTYENYLMAALPLTGNYHRKEEMEYHGKFGHTLGLI